MGRDEDFPDDETLKKQSYQGYKLSSVQEKNLQEIEKELKEGKLSHSNKEDVLDYLNGLHIELLKVREQEYSYEGEDNLNVNRYLQRVKKLIEAIDKL